MRVLTGTSVPPLSIWKSRGHETLPTPCKQGSLFLLPRILLEIAPIEMQFGGDAIIKSHEVANDGDDHEPTGMGLPLDMGHN